jgi:hypothetical protein
MWFDGENASFNMEIICNNIFIKGISISLQNYKMFTGKPLLRYFPA